jgi:hypothetical protein
MFLLSEKFGGTDRRNQQIEQQTRLNTEEKSYEPTTTQIHVGY